MTVDRTSPSPSLVSVANPLPRLARGIGYRAAGAAALYRVRLLASGCELGSAL